MKKVQEMGSPFLRVTDRLSSRTNDEHLDFTKAVRVVWYSAHWKGSQIVRHNEIFNSMKTFQIIRIAMNGALLCLFATVLTGCTIVRRIYIKNGSNESKVVSFIQPHFMGKEVSVSYLNDTRDRVTYNKADKMERRLELVEKDGALQLTIPPKAIAYLGEERILEGFAEALVVDSDTIEVERISLDKKWLTRRTSLNSFVSWFEFK